MSRRLKFGAGQSARRTEDRRLLTGTGRYTDDILLPNQAYLTIFRSPYAHGEITELNIDNARSSPDVIDIVTADDLTREGVNDVPGAGLPASSRTDERAPLCQPPLARDRVRYVGEPVVGIVAESYAAARDAADQISFDVNELDAAVSPLQALQPSAENIHEEIPGNLYGILEYGDAAATNIAFDKATTTVDLEIVNNRVAPTALEPRGCNVQFRDGFLKLYQGCQGVHVLRDKLALALGLDTARIHVVSPDVGGGFGLKYFLQCETVVASFAAIRIGRPVKWTADRNESFLADVHGRDHVSKAELALDNDGKIVAMRASITASIGAYCSQAGPGIPHFGACMTTGCYDIATAYVEVMNVVTNTVPVDAYRGAGRPEATYLIERLMDKAARAIDQSPAEFRRRNFIHPDQFPYTTPTGKSYDSGEYERLMDKGLTRADWSGFSARRSDSASRGRLRGIGMSYYVEICSGLGHETAHIRGEKDGRFTAFLGTQATGQGHETTYAQMIADALRVDINTVDIVEGDSERVPDGFGTVGSRSMVIGGTSLLLSIEEMLKAGKKVAARMFGKSEDEVELDAGTYRTPDSARTALITDVVIASYDDVLRPDDVSAGLASSRRFTPEGGTFPNGCHVCELEIDPDTGIVEILRYTVEDDMGVVVNPLILEGQIVGGIAQGLGQACAEEIVYEQDGGQLLTATLMDYPIPRADWIPDVDFRYQEIPSPRNPLGAKGAGEAGTVGSPPAYINALLNAMSVRGIDHIDMPATPLKVWTLLNQS